MSAFLLYILRSGLYLGIFYAFYMLVMRRTTCFRFNRAALLLGSVICALLPMLRLRTLPSAVSAGPLSISAVDNAAQAQAAEAGISWSALIATLYMTGAAAVLLYTLLSAWKMHKLTSNGRHTQKDGYKVVVLDRDLPSFTFGKTIFIGEKDLETHPAIFTHECMHVQCRHYLDLFLFRLIQMVWWWNPLVWMARTELGLLHEYEADEGVINKGIDATQYQLLLVRKAVGEQRFTLASGFQHAQLKNRITMMLKPSSNSRVRLYYLGLIPVMLIVVYACNPAKNSKTQAPAAEEAPASEAPAMESLAVQPIAPGDDVPTTVSISKETGTPDAETVSFSVVENKPTFNGGDANEFSKWVNSNLSYPQEAKDKKIQGRVTLQFTVDTDGSVKDVKVLRGVNSILDDEAVRVISNSPKWEPGTQGGTPVRVTYVFPVIFQLR